MKNLTLALIGVSIACSTAFASETLNAADKRVDAEVKALLSQGDTKSAYALLQTQYANTQQLDKLFLLAQLAKQNGKLLATKGYFEKMLTIDSNLSRVKLELADINLKLGYANASKELLEDVSNQQLPPNVKANIQNYLQAIEKGTHPKNTVFSVSTKLSFDSNVNSGPAVDTVTMFGLPFKLSDDAKENNDFGYGVSANVTHVSRMTDDIGIHSNLSASTTQWATFDQLNSSTLSARVGPSFRLSPRLSVGIPIDISKQLVAGKSYYWAYGVSPNISYRHSPKTSFNYTAVINQKRFDDSAKDNHALSLSTRLNHQISNSKSASLVATIGKEVAKNSGDNDFASISANFNAALSPKVTSFASLTVNKVAYKDIQPTYRKKRTDKSISVRGGVNYNVDNKTALFLDASHTNNDSSLAINTYKRNQMSVGLNANF